jgi:hypothetical protein
MTDSFLPEPVVVKQPKFTRVEGSRHSYAITANHVEKSKRGFRRPNILLHCLVRPPPQLAAKCDGDQRSSFQSCNLIRQVASRAGLSGWEMAGTRRRRGERKPNGAAGQKARKKRAWKPLVAQNEPFFRKRFSQGSTSPRLDLNGVAETNYACFVGANRDRLSFLRVAGQPARL